MNIKEMRERLQYKLEHHKCKRCGRELYIPKPPQKEYESWGIMAWTAFVKQYAKHHGWFELENLNRNLVCGECLQESDSTNNIILESYQRWEDEYNEWRQENTSI